MTDHLTTNPRARRRFTMPLLVRIIIAIVLGIGGGLVFPDWASRIFLTFNGIFSQFLGFIIPLLIVGFVAPAIADIGTRAGKMLLFTAVLAYVATLCSGLISYTTGALLFPTMIDSNVSISANSAAALSPFFTVEIPPLMSVMTALVLAFTVGIGATRLKTNSLRNGLSELRDIITMVINHVIIPLLPLYIFGIFVDMTTAGQVYGVLVTFSKIILVIFALHIFVIVFEYVVASLFSHKNPFRSIATMLPAYFTALGTQSSAATIPVTLAQTIKMGINRDVAQFVIPLCATIHMSGSALKIVACALALIIATGGTFTFGMFFSFIAMIGITIIAAPGVPGGAIMASLGLLTSMLGFSTEDNALMIALYIAMDSFGTACNVICDGALAQIVNRFFGRSAQ
jgi:Na+/H+-dicarboxylate symporter